jgi:3-hydroxyisobutyrate dehydrogenase-like beta-hydroxyacid dehydrogenase
MTTVGIVGLGLLGHAIATRLRGAGHAVVGYDVVPACVERLVALGGRPAKSAAEVARESEVVFTVLPSLAIVEEAILGADGVVAGARPGQTLCQMSTISPALTEHLARETTARGLTFLDCPISGTSAMVAQGHGVIFVGGDAAAYERWRPLLESILPSAVRIGDAGQAMLLKLVANLLVALNSASVAEALTLAKRGGLDPALTLEVLKTGAATSRMLEVRGPLMVRDEFPAQMKLDLFMKDLHLIQAAGAAAGARLPLTDVAEPLYAAALAAGHGGEDLAVVITALAEAPAARETESFQRFIFSTIDDLVGSLEGLSEAQLNWRPAAADTNSLYAIVTHVLGNAEENILMTVCGQTVSRSRAAELAARGTSWEPVRDHWRELRTRMAGALAALPAGELDRVRAHPRRGPLTGREVLLVVARHAAEHWGEAQLTRSLMR